MLRRLASLAPTAPGAQRSVAWLSPLHVRPQLLRSLPAVRGRGGSGQQRRGGAIKIAALFGRGNNPEVLYGKLRNGQSFSLNGDVWTAYVDKSSKATYYHNNRTGSSQWADPRPESGVDGPAPVAASRPQEAVGVQEGPQPAAPSQLTELQFKGLIGIAGVLGALALVGLFNLIRRPRNERPEDTFFPLGISDSMNEESPGGAAAAAQLSGSVLSSADSATEEDFFLPGSTAQLGLASNDLDESWDSRQSLTSVDLTIDEANPPPPGLDSEELPYTEEFFLPGSGATRGLTSQDLEASRTGTWDDTTVTIDEVERPGLDSEELPFTEEFFLPGSGASRGLTSQDLEASRTGTWDDTTVTIDEVERPGLDSEELPYTEEFFLPGSGASRGLTSQDLEARRTMDSDTEDDEPRPMSRGLPPPGAAAQRQGFIEAPPTPQSEQDIWASPQRSKRLPPGSGSVSVRQAAADATKDAEQLREQLDNERQQSGPGTKSLGAELVDNVITDDEAFAFGEAQVRPRGQFGPVVRVDEEDIAPAGRVQTTEGRTMELKPQFKPRREGSGGERARTQQLPSKPSPEEVDDAVALAQRMMTEYEGGTRRKKAGPVAQPVEEFTGEEVRLLCGARMLPHPDKVKSGGEDAYFVSRAGRGAVGVADGVGSWVMDGVNPAEFPRQLVANLEAALGQVQWADADDGLRQVLHLAHGSATAPGSATVVLAAAGPGGIVSVANLGDCGIRIVRDGECSFASSDMLHDYNMPFQLGRVEDDDLEEEVDSPDDAELYDIEVAPGDVLVIASDGLFDNLFDGEIADLVDATLNGEFDELAADRAASTLAAAATAKIRDTESRTPWVEAAAKAGELPAWKRMRPRGGKVDDVTVVVALVTKG